MKFLKQLLITTMLATLLATPCAAELTGTSGLEIDATEIDDQLQITVSSITLCRTRSVVIQCMYGHEALVRQIENHSMLGLNGVAGQLDA
jgi:hypothetical protein